MAPSLRRVLTAPPLPSREVCIQLHGRLGNQMFQYAAGLALARRIGARLTLDGAPAGSHAKSRIQIITTFGLREPCYHSGKNIAERLSRFLAHVAGVRRPPLRKHGLPIFHETGFEYDPTVFAQPHGGYLMGRWQSPRYFAAIEAEVRAAFTLRPPAAPDASLLAHRIAAEPHPVAVHLRRGDYATNPRTRARFGLCSRDYYDAARRHLEVMIGPGHYFVFSDDPAAAQAELAGWTDTTFVSGNSAETDLWLMQRCAHAVISNSTYAWWGAWSIAPSPEKVVIAPRQWFSPRMQRRKSLRDLYCPDWIQL